MEGFNELRRSTAKEEVAEWWRKAHAVFPAPGEHLVLVGYVDSKDSSPREMCEIWTTSGNNAEAIRGIDANQTQLANYHCKVHDDPISNVPSWEARLSCGKVKHYIEKCGVTVLRAVLHSNVAEVAGYISGNFKTDVQTQKRFVHVNHVCVLPQHRSAGIGHLLWVAFLEYFESQEARCTTDVALEVYMKNTMARKWYQDLGFEDVTSSDICRSMRLRSEEPITVVSPAMAPGAFTACQSIARLLKRVSVHLDVLPWGHVVAKLEEQVASLLDVSISVDDVLLSPSYLSGVFTGAWQVKVRGKSELWGRAFLGPLGVGFFDVRLQADSEAAALRAIRVDGIGGSLDGPFVVDNATLSQTSNDTLEWKWGKTGSSVWTRDVDAKSPLPSSAPAPGATAIGEFRRAIEVLRTCMESTRSNLRAIEGVADADVQARLRTLLEPRVRLPLAKLQEIEAKLDRLERKYSSNDSLKRKDSDNSEADAGIKKIFTKKFRSRHGQHTEIMA